MPGAIGAMGNWSLAVDTSGGQGAPAFTTIPGVRSVSGGGVQTDRIEVTAFDSPGNSKEYIGGLADPQARSFQMNFVPLDPTQHALRAANTSGSALSFKITVGTKAGKTETGAFTALVTRYGDPEGDPAKELSVAFELQPTGPTTWTPA